MFSCHALLFLGMSGTFGRFHVLYHDEVCTCAEHSYDPPVPPECCVSNQSKGFS